MLTSADVLHLKALLLDIKTPAFDLSKVFQLIPKYLPHDWPIIYDIGRPINILENHYHLNLKPYLQPNDGIASWIIKEELNLVDEVASTLDKAKIANTIISYGQIFERDSKTIENLCQLNTAHELFKKVFL